MSNRAYLVGSNTPDSPGISSDKLNYYPDKEILAGASNSMPILWLSLFNEENIVFHQVQEYQIPTLVTKYSEARQALSVRSSRIHAAFPEYSEAIKNWSRLLEDLPFEYIKVDALEVWMLNEKGFEDQLRAAIRWFCTGAEKDFSSLIELAEGSYDAAQQKIIFPDGYIIDYCLHGYRWVREVPWIDY